MNSKILVVDDDPTICALVQLGLEEAGLPSIVAGDGETALAMFESERPAAVVLDLMLPDMSGTDVLERIRARSQAVPVVVITADDDVSTAVECMRRGATDFLQKPFDNARLVATVENAHRQGVMASKLDAVSRDRRQRTGLATLRGESASLQRVLTVLEKAIATDVTILVQGESGTGKEVLARAIHAESDRCAAPFVPVNCGAIPDSLIESELFGHEKGAFTGAQSARPGIFEQASGGTVFLDEIGELRLDLQVRLLRVLQERTVKRLGADRERALDVRVIAATNRNLGEEVSAGTFREDLFYRLSVFPVSLPPLRDRADDVLILAEHFLEQGEHVRGPRSISKEAEAAMRAYPWPGNVRELRNVIERATILAEGSEIQVADLTDDIVCHKFDDDAGDAPAARPTGPSGIVHAAPATATDIVPLADVEKRAITEALQATGWNVKETAERLGIGRATLYRRIGEYGLERESSNEAEGLAS